MNLSVGTDGLQQVALPRVPGRLARPARQDAAHNLQQDMRNMQAFGDCQMQSSS